MNRPELVDLVADKLVELEAERRATDTRIAEAEAEEGFSIEAALGEVRTVGKALAADDSPENRLRCRAAIRRAVEGVWCLFPNGKGWRIAAVQVWFRGGANRSYILRHKSGGNSRWGKPWGPKTEVKSFSQEDATCGDLRIPAEAERLEMLLVKWRTGKSEDGGKEKPKTAAKQKTK
jgi:hypothetical protein